MLAADALSMLGRGLSSAISSMGIRDGTFGAPTLVEKQAAESARLFQGYAKAKPNKEDAYAAALAFLGGQQLDSWQRDLVASALAVPVREAKGAIALSSPKFPALLGSYEAEARRGDLWRLTWHGLLASYFEFDPAVHKDERALKNWGALREFLARTWPLISQQAGTDHVPDWVVVLRREDAVLSPQPADKYAKAFLAGDSGPAERLAADLGIPPSSWFWHALVLGAVQRATGDSDAEFKRVIPRLIQLIQSKPGFRDEALEKILVRYHACRSAAEHEQLRDFVVQPTVWKNPKLRAAGIATAWNRVPEPVWLMVMGWVNERNLQDFFDVLAARNQADSGRLAFWSQYLKQISWTRLVFGAETMTLKNRSPAVRNLIAREEGAYAELTANRDVDAFMMRIGDVVIVEFSKKPNAAYIYRASNLKFDLYQRHYSGGTDDLKYGYYDSEVVRITHTPGWETSAQYELKRLGIDIDREGLTRADYLRAQAGVEAPKTAVNRVIPRTPPAANHGSPETVSSASVDRRGTTPRGARFTFAQVQALVARFPGTRMRDLRNEATGRLWIQDSQQRELLERELDELGFRWSDVTQMWYFPEN